MNDVFRVNFQTGEVAPSLETLFTPDKELSDAVVEEAAYIIVTAKIASDQFGADSLISQQWSAKVMELNLNEEQLRQAEDLADQLLKRYPQNPQTS